MKKPSLLCLLCILLLSSCAQFSRYQTGRTLGKNKGQIGARVVPTAITGQDINVATGADVSVGYQYGLTERFDVGASLSMSTAMHAYGKYQFYGDKQSQFAGAFEAGYETIFWLGAAFEEELPQRFHVSLPLSVHRDIHAFFFTPKYVYQIVKDSNNSHFAAATVGYYWTGPKKLDFSIGYTGALVFGDSTFNTGESINQLGLAIHYNLFTKQ